MNHSPSGQRVAWSRRFPVLRPLAIKAHQVRRSLRWYADTRRGRVRWATRAAEVDLPHVVKTHASPLLRELSPDEMPLQHGKVTNLALAAASTDQIVLRPGESLSFNRAVGEATRRRGFADGMRIDQGVPAAGIGGGLCQLANLLHWLALHSDLTVVERSAHSVDLFPDQERAVPWGVGCTIVYNYVDLVLRNDTATDMAIHTWLDDTHLHGELRTAGQPASTYQVAARAERFAREDGVVWRSNEIWRTPYDAASGELLGEELVKVNRARVMYPVDEGMITRPLG